MSKSSGGMLGKVTMVCLHTELFNQGVVSEWVC